MKWTFGLALVAALGAGIGADRANAAALPVAVAATTVPILITPDGNFALGPQCTGSDCPAQHYHVTRNSSVLANISGICFRGIVGSDPYVMDGYGEWWQWSPANGSFVAVPAAAAPSPNCAALPYSADGSTLTTAGNGSLVTAAGTWTLATATCFGSQQIMLNGAPSGGCGTTLLVANDGQVYTRDSASNWWQWSGSAWSNLHTTTAP